MILVIGEVLIDMFDNYQRIGGAPFNFAFHLKQMGFPVRLITRVGDDVYGRQILDRIEASGFDTKDVQIDTFRPTGMVHVSVDDQGVPKFDIRTDVAYDYLQLDALAGAAGTSEQMIYLGTLAQRTQHSHEQFRRFMDKRAPQAKVFFDINLRPPHINPDAIDASLGMADIVKLNEDELEAIQKQFNGPEDRDDLARWLKRRFSIEWVVVTRGEEGSRIFAGERIADIPTPQTDKMVDTVGAGDAYAAVIAAGYLEGVPANPLGTLAAAFASRICSVSGAIPESVEMYPGLRKLIEGAADAK